MKRDNFTKKTIDVLSKRVGLICSNPNCRCHTSGPNKNIEKITLIGVAAHISAASIGGPRYDELITQEQRIHISNGIWLCSNCATLIDKDEKSFTKELLKQWKENAENEMNSAILENLKLEKPLYQKPYIEADLIYSYNMRLNKGHSPKNKKSKDGIIFYIEDIQIVFCELIWEFSFILHNNSTYPAYNIKIEELGDIKFSSLTKLPQINNLPPFANTDVKAKYNLLIEAGYKEADSLLKQRIPPQIEDIKLIISYLDENRKEHQTLFQIKNSKIKNSKIDS